MILVDTNLVSEGMRLRPHRAAMDWLSAQPWDSLYLCAPVLAELRYGAERLVAGRQKELLVAAVDKIEHELYPGRILPFDQQAAAHYAVITVKRERQGRPMAQMDALIAAIALAHGATVATRDVAGFAGIDLDIVNPFEGAGR